MNMNTTKCSITEQEIMPGVRALQAGPEDKEAVNALMVQAASWLKSKGSRQWNELLAGEDRHGVADAIDRGDVFIFKQDDMIAGMVILQQHASNWDRSLWGEEGHETSIYLHRLAINREFAGKQLGSAILHWAEHGIRFPGKDRVRLDCIASVPALNRLYSGAGFEYKDQSPSGFNLYEKMQPQVV
ncbi:GNAT family N-acetyltransferase [Paenibacillus sp. KQZ6P-2]|uniref:GNAT family N-acetyltransferase n=1 Tax=Paenibacillus mangrovi TaxID=2931978 RepID=A0A9X1WQN7_9BACL|nr:GNAT family N-acetyltransferase [Paenibacillus mangrovi]MCJ8011908.1 GNAT family N-acetyltransferase [Paenibacillus mangrovi]